MPVLLNKSLQYPKVFLYRIKIQRIRTEIFQYYSRPLAHLLNFFSKLCQKALSIIIIDFSSGYLPQLYSNSSIKSLNKAVSVDPQYTRLRRIPSWVYAGRICYLLPQLNLVTSTSEVPLGDHPQRRCPTLLSQPDLLTKIRQQDLNWAIVCK